jgi:WD40 repeat protein
MVFSKTRAPLLVIGLGIFLFFAAHLSSCSKGLQGDSWSLKERRLISALAFSPNGKYLAVGTQESEYPSEFWKGQLIIWDVPNKKVIASTTLSTWIQSLAFSPDSKKLAVGCGIIWGGARDFAGFSEKPGRLLILEFPSLIEKASFEEGSMVKRIAFSPDGKTLASSSSTSRHVFGKPLPAKVKLWDIVNWKVEKIFDQIQQGLAPISFSSDGQLGVADSKGNEDGRTNGILRIYDHASGKEKVVLAQGTGAFRFIEFSPRQNILAFISERTDAVGLVEVETGKDIASDAMKKAFAGTQDLAFSPDGKLLIAICNKGGGPSALGWVVIWDMEKKRERMKIDWPGKRKRLTALAISPNSELLALGTARGEIKIFHLPQK